MDTYPLYHPLYLADELNVMNTVPSVPNVPTVPEEKGINGTVVDTSGNSKDIHAHDACKEQLSSYGTLVPLGTVGTLGTTSSAGHRCSRGSDISPNADWNLQRQIQFTFNVLLTLVDYMRNYFLFKV
jgi:hypothetical protein